MKKSNPKTVAEYIRTTPEPARTTLKKVRAFIQSVAPPGTTETISYQIPMFSYKGALFGYAAFTNHCSLFPMGSSVIQMFKDDLKSFETSKGTIRFPVDKPPPAALVKKLVKARIAQNELKTKSPRA